MECIDKYGVKWNFLNCLWAIDRHCILQAPIYNSIDYFNYYCFFVCRCLGHNRVSDVGVYSFFTCKTMKLNLPSEEVLDDSEMKVSHMFVEGYSLESISSTTKK